MSGNFLCLLVGIVKVEGTSRGEVTLIRREGHRGTFPDIAPDVRVIRHSLRERRLGEAVMSIE